MEALGFLSPEEDAKKVRLYPELIATFKGAVVIDKKNQ